MVCMMPPIQQEMDFQQQTESNQLFQKIFLPLNVELQ